jgi:hypothetical protein
LVGGRRALGSSKGGCVNLQLPSGGLPPRLQPPWKQYSLQGLSTTSQMKQRQRAALRCPHSQIQSPAQLMTRW